MSAPLHGITLAHPADWAGFRQSARACLQAGLAPEAVEWRVQGDAEDSLFAAANAGAEERLPALPLPKSEGETATALHVPRELLALCESCILHRHPERFALVYRLLWRLQRDPGLRHDALDPDRVRLARMAAAVRRDIHKMRAFVRFRPVTGDLGAEPWHLAWFEPDHFITEANARFFVQRFTQMRWAILTPDCSLRWDGQALEIGPGGTRADAPAADAGESLWLTYYAHTFNPARLKLAMMRREMPTRYWKNLPEAPLIDGLARGAHERSAHMVAAQASTPQRRIPPRR